MSKKTVNTVFPFFVSDPLVSTPDNSNLLQFSLKVRVIKIRLCIFNGVSLYRELNAMKNFSYFGSMRCLLEICKFFCMCLLVKCIFKKEEDHLFINQVKPLHQTSSSFTKKKKNHSPVFFHQASLGLNCRRNTVAPNVSILSLQFAR